MAESTVPQIYVDLSTRLVNYQISPNEFMVLFLREFKDEKRFFDDPTGKALNALFYAAEEFVDYPSSRPGVVDEAQLRVAARGLLRFVEMQKRE